MLKEELLNKDSLPRHLAIIMDGNGRWAKQRNKPRTLGHQNGVDSVKEITETSAKLGIEFLTLHAFSVENWRRPKSEIKALLSIMSRAIEKEFPNLVKTNIRLHIIGALDDFPKNLKNKFLSVVENTKNNTGLTLTIALSYSSRDEIQKATKIIVERTQQGILSANDINEETIEKHLFTNHLPDVDLLIRTSGERRLSNFLLWQVAYSELYFTKTLWPDFRKDDLVEALIDYQGRERRFGKTGEQLSQDLECQKI